MIIFEIISPFSVTSITPEKQLRGKLLYGAVTGTLADGSVAQYQYEFHLDSMHRPDPILRVFRPDGSNAPRSIKAQVLPKILAYYHDVTNVVRSKRRGEPVSYRPSAIPIIRRPGEAEAEARAAQELRAKQQQSSQDAEQHGRYWRIPRTAEQKGYTIPVNRNAAAIMKRPHE